MTERGIKAGQANRDPGKRRRKHGEAVAPSEEKLPRPPFNLRPPVLELIDRKAVQRRWIQWNLDHLGRCGDGSCFFLEGNRETLTEVLLGEFNRLTLFLADFGLEIRHRLTVDNTLLIA